MDAFEIQTTIEKLLGPHLRGKRTSRQTIENLQAFSKRLRFADQLDAFRAELFRLLLQELRLGKRAETYGVSTRPEPATILTSLLLDTKKVEQQNTVALLLSHLDVTDATAAPVWSTEILPELARKVYLRELTSGVCDYMESILPIYSSRRNVVVFQQPVPETLRVAVDQLLDAIEEKKLSEFEGSLRGDSGPAAGLPELTMAVRGDGLFDAFISHASEDKESVVIPLWHALQTQGLRIWLDKNELTIGDSLRAKIDHGLTSARFGIVVLSPNFFAKHWTQRELNGLAAREQLGRKIILPVWHDVDHDFVARYSPMLADRFAASTSSGINNVVKEVLRVLRPAEARQ